MNKILVILFTFFLYNCNTTPGYTSWPDATVKYTFIGLNSEQIASIHEAMLYIHTKTCGLIKFKLTEEVGDGILNITSMNSNTLGGVTLIGYYADTYMPLLLNSFTQRVIRHELIHTLGIPDEVRRPDAFNYITINWELAGGMTGYLLPFTPDDYLLYAFNQFEYDYNSIVHYSEEELNGILDTKGKNVIGSEELSNIDLLKLYTIYGN